MLQAVEGEHPRAGAHVEDGWSTALLLHKGLDAGFDGGLVLVLGFF